MTSYMDHMTPTSESRFCGSKALAECETLKAQVGGALGWRNASLQTPLGRLYRLSQGLGFVDHFFPVEQK